MSTDQFARRVFVGAGIYGLVCLAPMYGLESLVGQVAPPPITHPEFFYGFIGVALAWQLAFLVIGRDPVRFRPLMLPAIVEKVTYGAATLLLIAAGRTDARLAPTAVIDLVLAVLFA